jgi:iron complex transport system substrate-binding protein
MLIRILFTCIVSSFLLSCGGGEKRDLVKNAPTISVTYTDATGRAVNLKQIPQKVISLAPNITEMIYLIGAEEKLIARSQACDYPPAVLDKEEVTTYPAIDREQLKSLGADMLLATNELFGPDAISSIEEVGLPVYLQAYDSLPMVFDAMRTLGKILEVEDRSNAVADSLDAILAKIVKSTEPEIKYGTIMIVSTDPLIVVGGKGFLNEMIQKAGGKNALGDLDQAYAKATVEAILAAQPEYIILPSKTDQVYADLISLYPALINTPADKSKQVYIVDPDLFYRPGPRMLDGLLELTGILHSTLNRGQFVE